MRGGGPEGGPAATVWANVGLEPGEEYRMRLVGLIVPTVLAVLCGCSAAPPPGVPVTSSRGGVRQPAGERHGDFWSSQTGRHGRTWFQLGTAADTATGQVAMYLRTPAQPVGRRTGRP